MLLVWLREIDVAFSSERRKLRGSGVVCQQEVQVPRQFERETERDWCSLLLWGLEVSCSSPLCRFHLGYETHSLFVFVE